MSSKFISMSSLAVPPGKYANLSTISQEGPKETLPAEEPRVLWSAAGHSGGPFLNLWHQHCLWSCHLEPQHHNSVLGCLLDSVQLVGEKRVMAKLLSLMQNRSQPMQDTLRALESSFSDRLFHHKYVKMRYCRSFLPAAVRLYYQNCSQ